jgi:hypothetical protein
MEVLHMLSLLLLLIRKHLLVRAHTRTLTSGVVNDRTLSKSFANELSKVFNIDEDPAVEELESSVREKLFLCIS